MRVCDAVMIGGGWVGTSVSYHLGVLGCPDTVLLGAEALAAGSTGKAAGGIRVQHDDEVNTRIALRFLDEFTRDVERLIADGQVTEMFVSGTAAIVAGIGKVTSPVLDLTVGDGKEGPLTRRLRAELAGLQRGTRADTFGWTRRVA